MTPVKIEMGSIWIWLTLRMSAAVVLIAAWIVVLNDFPLGWGLIERFLLLGMIFAVVIFLGEDLAYGYANEVGVHYRRYLLERIVPWKKVAAIRWSGSGRITVKFRQGFFLRKDLWMQDFRSSSPAELSSLPPKVVRWLLSAKPEGSDGILLEGPGT